MNAGTHRKLPVLVLLALACTGNARADEVTCGELRNSYGPFDYYEATPDQRSLVENIHFTPDVENLRKGATGTLAGDIDYTLRAFPNHPRALSAMMNLQFKLKSERPPGANYPVECYFDRALRFRPEDPTARAVYGIYLLRLKRSADAVKQLSVAAEARPENANIQYNLGLAYFEAGNFDLALAQAHKAYKLNYQLPGLRNMLEKAGRWKPAT